MQLALNVRDKKIVISVAQGCRNVKNLSDRPMEFAFEKGLTNLPKVNGLIALNVLFPVPVQCSS